MINEVCEKGYKNNPLTDVQIANNREKSRVQSRVEHIFGFMEGSMNGMYLYAIGKKNYCQYWLNEFDIKYVQKNSVAGSLMGDVRHQNKLLKIKILIINILK